jgi:LysM repeat protein
VFLLLLAVLLATWPLAASAATPAAISAQTTTYTVRSGDTLLTIARRFKTMVTELMRLNGIAYPNYILAGQQLIVPDPASPTPAISLYVVQAGDTLSTIARRFNTTMAALSELNQLADLDLVRVGQVLIIPGSGEGPLPSRIRFAEGGSLATVSGSVNFPQRPCYILGGQAGQTMTVIAISPDDRANFLLRALDPSVNDGVPLKRLENEERMIALPLPVTGDYAICLATASGNVEYTLTVEIPPLCRLNTAIRATDWLAVLASEPLATHEMIDGDHYLTVIAAPDVSGIPLADQVIYGDFDDDCNEEAALPLASGGTAGNTGFLVYRDAQPRPTLTAWGSGYKQGLALLGNRLTVSNALYAGWEANCCPSGIGYDVYRLNGASLSKIATRSVGIVEMQLYTVEYFYLLLQGGDFSNAYALLSPAVQAENPFAAWQAGYANTQSFTFTTTPGPLASNRVQVAIEAVERLSDGGTRVQRYRGSWLLAWDGARPGWVMEQASFSVAP